MCVYASSSSSRFGYVCWSVGHAELRVPMLAFQMRRPQNTRVPHRPRYSVPFTVCWWCTHCAATAAAVVVVVVAGFLSLFAPISSFFLYHTRTRSVGFLRMLSRIIFVRAIDWFRKKFVCLFVVWYGIPRKQWNFSRSQGLAMKCYREIGSEKEWAREFILCVFFTIFSLSLSFLFSNIRAEKKWKFLRFIFSPSWSISPWFRLTSNPLPIKSHKIELFTAVWLISLDISCPKICCITVTEMSIDISMLWNAHCFPFHGQPRTLFCLFQNIYETCMSTSSLKNGSH